MQITHGKFEIHLGLPLMAIDGKYMVAWGLYRMPRTAGDQPEYLGTTIGISEESLAVATALAESRLKANELA